MIWFQKCEEGGWVVLILAQDFPALIDLPGRMRKLLESTEFSDKVVTRLFPQAYPKDPEAEAEYQRLLRNDLLKRKLDVLETVERSMAEMACHTIPSGAKFYELRLSDTDLSAWLGFLHDMRLTIGTALDITDESWESALDPDAQNFDEVLLLNQLSYFEEALIEALRDAEGLDDEELDGKGDE